MWRILAIWRHIWPRCAVTRPKDRHRAYPRRKSDDLPLAPSMRRDSYCLFIYSVWNASIVVLVLEATLSGRNSSSRYSAALKDGKSSEFRHGIQWVDTHG
jgi:hypothetical protein